MLERRDQVGGACTLEEPWPGYAISPCAYLAGLLHPLVVDELRLDRHGYELIPLNDADPYITVPREDGSAFTEWIDEARTVEELGVGDGRGYQEYTGLIRRIRDALRPDGPDDLWLAEPPSRDEIEARLGGDEVAIATVFEDSHTTMLERFFSERVVDALAGQGVIGTFASPRDPGTAYISWHHSSGRLTGVPGAWTYVRGGMGRVSFALADAAREAGAVIETGAPVRAIHPGQGVELEDGTAIAARAVVCNADARRAARAARRRRARRLPRARRGGADAEPGAEGQLRALRPARSSPPPTTPRAARSNCIRGAQAMHDACRLAQAGDVADELWCELYFQTVADPSVAPEGRHVMSAFCQYVPYELAEGTWDERRDELADRVETSIERFAPGFRALVVSARRSARPTSSARSGSPAATSSRASACPSSCGIGGCPTAPGPRASTCAARAPTPGGSVIAVNGRNAALAVLGPGEG